MLRDLLALPTYRRLWLSGLCLNVARWMDMVALGWLALSLTGSPLLVGVAAFARTAPVMLLGPLAGTVADRVHRGRVLVASQALGLVAAGALVALLASGRGGYAALVGIEVLFGVLWALDFPSRRTALYEVVGPARVATAVSLETVSMQAGKMAGPVAAGLLLAHLHPAVCYGVVAALYLAGLAVAVGLAPRLAGPAARAPQAAAGGLAAALDTAWRDPTARAVLLATVAMNVLFFPYQHMLPVYARVVLDAGAEWLGFLVAADGLGSLAGALAIAARRRRPSPARLFAAAVLVAPGLLVALAVTPWRAGALLILLLMGFAEAGFATMQSTLILLSAPEEGRGRALGLLSACIGTQPLGTLWIGFLTGRLGITLAMATAAGLALGALVPAARPLWRGRARPPGAPLP